MMASTSETGERPITDFGEVLDAKFRCGEGVLSLHSGMSDAVLVAAVRAALAHGVPFRVVPVVEVKSF